jgi:2,4-dienoyl-CoA reductase-like NADH-dependent reductase (Old Yellow Enzyme family)
MVICFNSLTERNHRTDGGSIENKARIFFEVLDAIKVIPEEKIGARFNPSLHGPFGTTMDEKQSQRLNTSLKN